MSDNYPAETDAQKTTWAAVVAARTDLALKKWVRDSAWAVWDMEARQGDKDPEDMALEDIKTLQAACAVANAWDARLKAASDAVSLAWKVHWAASGMEGDGSIL